jgi:hypothetical protein
MNLKILLPHSPYLHLSLKNVKLTGTGQKFSNISLLMPYWFKDLILKLSNSWWISCISSNETIIFTCFYILNEPRFNCHWFKRKIELLLTSGHNTLFYDRITRQNIVNLIYVNFLIMRIAHFIYYRKNCQNLYI